ncbi:hypothetical protein ACFV2C_27575 [[Kitasatospora] papulosa]|uniref:hypothetical protein n=1 Tax=[Kitasatospora] papulosa TaxID=1464011 RepID=UPI0036BC0DA2
MNEPSHPQPEQSQFPGRQPGFGFAHPAPPPSQAPQPPMSPGFGHAQGPGHAGGSLDMPQRVKAARITLFLLAGLLIILGLAALAQADAAQSSLDPYRESSGLLAPAVDEAEEEAAARMMLGWSALFWGVVYAVVALVVAARFGKGRNALRIGTIVYGAWLCAVGTFTLGFTGASALGTMIMTSLVELAAGVLLIVFMSQRDSVTWFNRPRR